jgi:hypothetical protein
MDKLIRVLETAMRDARRSEALMNDAAARLALRSDPEGALLSFELRTAAAGDENDERENQMLQRRRGVRAARQTVLG